MTIKKDGYEYWDYSEYKLLSLMPVSGIFCVFCCEQEDGSFKQQGFPLDVLCVAEVTVVTRRRRSDLPRGEGVEVVSEVVDDNNSIVGASLTEGHFQICEQASNFSGYMKEGDDIEDVTWYLEPEHTQKLKKQKKDV